MTRTVLILTALLAAPPGVHDETCGVCGGSGKNGGQDCWQCGGEGTVEVAD